VQRKDKIKRRHERIQNRKINWRGNSSSVYGAASSLPPSWVIIKCNTLISENRGEERPREDGGNEGRKFC
jgi:hypothetical protein